MEKIFDKAKDKNVAATVIYGKSSDGKAYADADGNVQLTTSELKDAFLKRAVIIIGTDYYIPTGYSVVSKAGKVSYVKAAASGTSADIATLTAIADK